MLAPSGERLSMVKLGRAPKAAAGSKDWEFAPKATAAIWLARMLHTNRRADIVFLLEHIVAVRKASAPILSGSVLCAQFIGGSNADGVGRARASLSVPCRRHTARGIA